MKRSLARTLRSDTARRAFERMAAKGGCARPTSQESADRALAEVRHLLTADEVSKLGTARCHVLEDGCNRREWDTVCAAVRVRIWPSIPELRQPSRDDALPPRLRWPIRRLDADEQALVKP